MTTVQVIQMGDVDWEQPIYLQCDEAPEVCEQCGAVSPNYVTILVTAGRGASPELACVNMPCGHASDLLHDTFELAPDVLLRIALGAA